jgi:hypothetical protein
MTRCTQPGCLREAVVLPLCRQCITSRGGKARAATLSLERRKEIARKAHQSRKPSTSKGEQP